MFLSAIIKKAWGGGPAWNSSEEEDFPRDKEYFPATLASLCAILLGFGIAGLVAMARQNPLDGAEAAENTSALFRLFCSMLPMQLLAFGFCLLLLIPLFLRYGVRKTLDIPENRESAASLFGNAFRMLLLLLCILVGVNGLSTLLCRLLGIQEVQPAMQQLSATFTSPVEWGVALLLALVLAPVTEEVVFRVVMFRFIRSRIPAYASMATALFFALLHGNAYGFAGLFVVGIFLQRARFRGGLPRAVLVHSMYNAVAFVYICLQN